MGGVIQAAEAGSLAREMAASVGEMIRYYEAQAKNPNGPVWSWDDDSNTDAAQMVGRMPAHEVSWFDIARVARADPEVAQAVWDKIGRAAADDLASGHRAAKTIEVSASPWDRAKFLASRDALREAWQPRNGIEETLINNMAQAQVMSERFLELVVLRTYNASAPRTIDARGWAPIAQSDADAIQQSAEMADRFNRLFLRQLRALQELRRRPTGVVVQSAQQVNVGAQQINIAES